MFGLKSLMHWPEKTWLQVNELYTVLEELNLLNMNGLNKARLCFFDVIEFQQEKFYILFETILLHVAK